MANIDALEFCRKNNIDCSGSHVYKYPRRFAYALVRDSDGRALVTVTYYKNRVPTYSFNE